MGCIEHPKRLTKFTTRIMNPAEQTLAENSHAVKIKTKCFYPPRIFTPEQKRRRKFTQKEWYKRKIITQDFKDRMRRNLTKWRSENPEQVKKTRRKWCQKNKIIRNQQSCIWRKNNPFSPQEKRRRINWNNEWALRNRSKVLGYKAAYNLRNPEKLAIYNHRRRAVLKSNSTPDQIKSADEKIRKMLSFEKTACAYCRGVFVTVSEMEIDHILALSRGGVHSATNILMACRRCNRSKHNKILFDEWTPPSLTYAHLYGLDRLDRNPASNGETIHLGIAAIATARW